VSARTTYGLGTSLQRLCCDARSNIHVLSCNFPASSTCTFLVDRKLMRAYLYPNEQSDLQSISVSVFCIARLTNVASVGDVWASRPESPVSACIQGSRSCHGVNEREPKKIGRKLVCSFWGGQSCLYSTINIVAEMEKWE
jgi:hypothetical protein